MKQSHTDQWEAEHRRDHAALAALSSKGKLTIAEKSAHDVQLDQPELVVTTIAELTSSSLRSR
jgi:pimeloyl-ACP methyl ester carboxylesterase